MLDREPYAGLPQLPEFTLTSDDVAENQPLALDQASGAMGIEGGKDIAPHLSWSGAPEGTKSYVVTCFDPDAPTPSGFWHLSVSNIPADVTELPNGWASQAIDGAVKHLNDGGNREFTGAAPPPGHGAHRYIFCVTAVDTEKLDVDESASPAVVNFNLFFHGIGRAFLTGTYEVTA